MSPDVVLALCRVVHDAATMLVWGAFAFLATLVPRTLAQGTGEALRRFRLVAIILAVISTFLMLPLEAAVIGDGWPDAINPETVGAVLSQTSVGTVWTVEVTLALLLAATLLIPSRLPAATSIASGCLLASAALTGHAAMHAGHLGVAHRLNDAVHLLAGGAWMGALVPLLLLIRGLDDPRQDREAGVALRRFSFAGHGAVALVILTGIGNMMLVLGRPPTQWSSPYQAMLAAKIVVVFLMTALALFNRYILIPRLRYARVNSLRALRQGTMTEIGLGLAAVGLVGFFGMLQPA